MHLIGKGVGGGCLLKLEWPVATLEGLSVWALIYQMFFSNDLLPVYFSEIVGHLAFIFQGLLVIMMHCSVVDRG